MAYCCDSPTCASCCLKTVSVTVTLFLMAICVERLVLDLLGFQWTGCIFDFATLLSCLFAVAAVCQLRPGFCYAVGAWLLAWIGWNAFLICYYLDVNGLLDRAASVLHWGTGKTSYWYRLLLGCSDYGLQLRLPVPLLGSSNGTSSAWWCLVDYRTAELLHCIASGGVALLSLMLLACLACQLREELRKFDQPIMAAAYLPVSADSSFAKARPGRRMTRRRDGNGDQLEGPTAASLSSAVPDGHYADNSLGRRSAGSRRSSVMRDPLPWVELQVTAVPPPPQQLPPPPQSDESDDGDASEFFDDARPPPYSAASFLDGVDSRRRRQQQKQQQQPRRRHRSAGSSGRKRKQNRRRAAAATTAQPVGSLAPTAAAIPRPSSAIGYHDNLAYSRDDEFDDPPPPPPPAPQLFQPQPFVPQLGIKNGGGVVNRTFRLSSESVAAGTAGPATPYASGAAPLFMLQQPLQSQRPPMDYNEDEFPPPPSPMLVDSEPPPPPPPATQTSMRPLQKPPQALPFSQQPAQVRTVSQQQHRPMRNSNQQQQSMSRSRAPISPEAAFAGLDQLDSGSRLSLRGGPQQQQYRTPGELKPIFVSTRNEAASVAAAVGPPSIQRHVTSPSPGASLPRQPSYVSATSPGARSGVTNDSVDAGLFPGGVHGSSVLI